MSVVGTPEGGSGVGTSGVTYAEVLEEVRLMLHDEEGTFNWSDELMLMIANDGVELIRKMLAGYEPDMFIASEPISVIAGNAGPYVLPDGCVYPEEILDSNNKPLDNSSRGAELQYVASRTREPRKYWLEGWGPIRLYFDSTPGQAYTFTLKYMPKFTRATVATEDIPIPSDCRTALRAWCEKIAGIVDEYNTMDEEQKLSMLLPLLSKDVVKRANEVTFSVSGVEF